MGDKKVVDETPVAVASRSFSRNPVLRAELLERYPNTRFNDEGRTLKGKDLVDFMRGCKKIITALERIDEAFLSQLPELEVIGKYGVGTDMIDMEAMARHGVRLGWKGGVNRRSVAELTISFMIALLRLVPEANLDVRNGVWKNRIGRELSHSTVGIIGCGNIGKDLAVLLRAFGTSILSHDILDFPEFYAKHQIKAVSLDELLKRSDIVTLHVPLDESTKNMLNKSRLEQMLRGACLINAARGGLVDESALKELLKSGHLGGAAFDVFGIEPPEDRELLELPNFLATPHIGGSSCEAVLAMGRAAIEGLDVNEFPLPEKQDETPR